MRTYSNPITELFNPGTAITAHATDPLTLGQFVTITGGDEDTHVNVTVAPAGARAFGLAQTDADADTKVGIQRGNGRCFRVPTTASITAGQDIEVGTDGQPAPHAEGIIVAQALHASTGEHVDLTLI